VTIYGVNPQEDIVSRNICDLECEVEGNEDIVVLISVVGMQSRLGLENVKFGIETVFCTSVPSSLSSRVIPLGNVGQGPSQNCHLK
jgi:hypothetical protein